MCPVPQQRRSGRNASSLVGCGLLVLLTLIPRPCLADQPPAKPPSKQAQAELRQYLPVLLQKALLENDRELVAQMEKLFDYCKVSAEAGFLDYDKLDQTERLLLEDRIRVVRRQAAYNRELDGFRIRFTVPAERLQQWEDSALLPLRHHLQAFEALDRDFQAACKDSHDDLHAADRRAGGKLRPLIEKAGTSSKLVAGTQFRRQFVRSWKKWNEVKDLNAALDVLWTARFELEEQRRRKEKPKVVEVHEPEMLPAPGRPQQKKAKAAPRIRLRPEEIHFEIAMGRLEEALREYEKEPWKNKQEFKSSYRSAALASVRGWLYLVLNCACWERLTRLEQSLPSLPPVRVEKVNLLTCKPEQVEAIITARLKDRAATLAAKTRVYNLRAAAEIYPLQQHVVRVGFIQRKERRDELSNPRKKLPRVPTLPPPPPRNPWWTELFHLLKAPQGNGEGVAMPGPPRPPEPSEDALFKVVAAQQALSRAKADLIHTWFSYQQLRLELYESLGIP